MKSKILRTAAVITLCLGTFGLLAGCDKAEQIAEKADLGTATELTSLVNTLVKTLGGITDLESAKAKLADLKQVDVDLDKIVSKVKDMSPEQKSQMTAAVGKVMPQLEGAMEKVTSMPGAEAVIGPTLESLKSKFKSLM